MQFEPGKRGRRRARQTPADRDERALHETALHDAALQTMLDHIGQGIAMFDSSHRLVAWNAQLQALLELPETALSDKPSFEQFVGILAERGDFGSSASADNAVRALTSALDQPHTDERMLADGRILQCRRDPLPAGGLIVTYTDVSEQRHSDYLVKDSERQVRTILDKSPVALAVIGQEDGELKHVNARFRRLFGIADQARPEAIDLATYIQEGDRDRILATQAGAQMVDFEARVRRADGSEFWALIAPVRFVFEWAPAILTGVYDITDRKVAEGALREELKRKQAELTEARTLQLELAPASERGVIGDYAFSIDVVLEPAREVGGDLVDHFRIGENLLVLALGDVSHKGAGSALFMARTHSLIRSIAARPDAFELFREPARAIEFCNAALAKNNATSMFVTLLLATFDAQSGRLSYVRAGHLPPFLRRVDGSIERLAVSGGPPLGVIEDIVYKQGSVALQPGDQMLTVTDGITEAMDLAGKQFGEGPIEDFLASVGPDETTPLTRLVAAVKAHEQDQPAFDDIACILLAISPPAR
jgi:PAS domain S-box-containing protein